MVYLISCMRLIIQSPFLRLNSTVENPLSLIFRNKNITKYFWIGIYIASILSESHIFDLATCARQTCIECRFHQNKFSVYSLRVLATRRQFQTDYGHLLIRAPATALLLRASSIIAFTHRNPSTISITELNRPFVLRLTVYNSFSSRSLVISPDNTIHYLNNYRPGRWP